MAKHIKNPSSFSKGLRRSSNSIKRAVVNTYQPGNVVPTAMREAFEQSIMGVYNWSRLHTIVEDAGCSGAGSRKLGKGWNASLSFRTAQELKATGILQ